MDSMRKTALVAGIFYLITFISIPTLALYGPVKTDPNFILSVGGDTAILVGGLLETIVALAGIGTAVALFSVLKRQHEGFALGLVTTRIFEGAVIMIGVSSILSVVTLQQAGAAGAEAAALVAVGQAQIATFNWSFLLGQSLMPALNADAAGHPDVPIAPRPANPSDRGTHRSPSAPRRHRRNAVRVHRAVRCGLRDRSPDRAVGAVARPVADLQGLQPIRTTLCGGGG